MAGTRGALTWLSSADDTARIFIESADADADLCESCLTRLTALMLLSWFGHVATFATPYVSGLMVHWHWHGRLPWDWDEAQHWAAFLPTLGAGVAVLVLDILVWPARNRQQREARGERKARWEARGGRRNEGHQGRSRREPERRPPPWGAGRARPTTLAFLALQHARPLLRRHCV